MNLLFLIHREMLPVSLKSTITCTISMCSVLLINQQDTINHAVQYHQSYSSKKYYINCITTIMQW